tara:strand:+ start:20295 stop:23054 length:2760 start_codon:yes stop_codon:yes gene_type:complete
MSQNNTVSVTGYAQRVFYNGGIEYRNFSDGLVGNQQTEGSDGETSVFTFGNFVTTTNYGGRLTRVFSTKKFSDFYSLDNYNLTTDSSKLILNNNINTTLNLDNTNLCDLVYFGSATEFIRVSLENIITNWPASLYVEPLRSDGINTIAGDTVLDYSYNPTLNRATFNIDVNFINNKFDINILNNGTILNTFNEKNKLRNLAVTYADYVVLINSNEYKLLGFSGANSISNDTIKLEVEGDPFGFNGSTNSTPTYHIKPNKLIEEYFFNTISQYEDNLLNRLTVPKYTSTYKYNKEEDDGTVTITDKTLTWPVTDGYNIDYNTAEYVRFVGNLIEIANSKDGIQTNLMTRFLTAGAISDFDTVPNCEGSEEETAGQKMNKTLKIYGREFDEIKKYIDGISFANVVTYDKKKNTPDQLVKYLARVLGWELTSSIIENDLINSYLNVGARTYAGQSRGLTPVEAETELWRRLILNSSWIWKSKGTRKTIEFFFKLIGAPDGLIEFDEHVYVAKAPIDMDLFYATLEANNLDDDISLYNVDDEGYPKFFRDTPNMYFQKGGQWYRQTGGEAATQYILNGNNPHVGPYDGGKEYINQLENIIPDFTPFTLTSTTITTNNTKLFTNYNSGLFNQYSGATFITLQNDNGISLTGTTAEASIIKDPCPQIEQTDCGCDIPEDDEALKIEITNNFTGLTKLQKDKKCEEGSLGQNIVDPSTSPTTDGNYFEVEFELYEPNGAVSNTHTNTTKWLNPNCCEALAAGSKPFYHEEYVNTSTGTTGSTMQWELVNCGYLCVPTNSTGLVSTQIPFHDSVKRGVGSTLSCQWVLAGPTIGNMELIDSGYYLKFIDPKGNQRVVNTDTGFCPVGLYTIDYKLITDPYTGEKGYGCKLNTDGVKVFTDNPTKTNIIYQLYEKRARDIIGCYKDII